MLVEKESLKIGDRVMAPDGKMATVKAFSSGALGLDIDGTSASFGLLPLYLVKVPLTKVEKKMITVEAWEKIFK